MNFDAFSWPNFTLLPWGYGIMFIAMTMIYGLSRQLKNAGVVDVFWGFGNLFLVIFYGLLSEEAWHCRQWGLALLIGLASLRLGFYLLKRFLHEYPVEDARYTEYRKAWGKNAELMVFAVFQFQGVLLTTLSIPLLLVLSDTQAQLNLTHYSAAGIFMAGWLGEALADHQLAQFKANPENKGKTCQIGLWQVSRHPNYFFEWLMWVSIAVYASASPFGWLAWISPALMLYFLLFVTGIKATEERALVSRSDYAAYQQKTSAFIPWFPKKIPSA